MRVSDLITNEEIKKWKIGDTVTIKAGTGSGKSHFIKNKLFLHAKKNNEKILMLLHRKNTVDQFKNEIRKQNKSQTITIITYQYLESAIKNKYAELDDLMNKHTYLICDEYHYWLSDSLINRHTELSLNHLIKQQNKIKIFMSGTSNLIKTYLNNELDITSIDYELVQNKNHINDLYFFYSDDTYTDLIEEFKVREEKTIFFIDNPKVVDLYLANKDNALFNCSTNYTAGKSYLDEEKINNMLVNESFDELFLFTTTVMDAGININDKNVKNIVVDVTDLDKLIQCVGRRRIDYKDLKDKINIYIKALTNKQINGFRRKYQTMLKRPDNIQWSNAESYLQRYSRNNDKYDIVFTDIDDEGRLALNVNRLKYFQIKQSEKVFAEMLKIGYIDYLKKIFGKHEHVLIEQKKEKESLEEYLKGIIDKRLYTKDEKEELFRQVNLRNGNNNRLIRNLNTVQEYIKQEFDSKYILVSRTDNKRRCPDGSLNENRRKVYYVVISEKQ